MLVKSCLLSFYLSLVTSVRATLFEEILNSGINGQPVAFTIAPVCLSFKAELQGEQDFVDVDNSGGLLPTIGDKIIAQLASIAIEPLAVPGASLEITSICTVTTPGSAPSCTYEATLFNLCTLANRRCYDKGKFFFGGTGPDNLAIAGGTEEFFGAFGEVDLESVGGGPPGTGPLELRGKFALCFWSS